MSQTTWTNCLYWAAHHGLTLKQAVIAYRKRAREPWPSGVTPAVDRSFLGEKVAALYPEYTRRNWTAK